MAGPHRGPGPGGPPPGGPGGPGARGGFQKPKHARKTALRLFTYVGKSKLTLLLVLVCLLASVGTNLAGTYLQRGIINDFIWSGCTDVGGFLLSILGLAGVYLLGAGASYVQS
ncbi:MAG: ABC transporter ATP-binding protein, partial [Oscillospiraceae bacterium]|nr:ABC transporter ATP-binding protein [Oscillospiraceae bacterium]